MKILDNISILKGKYAHQKIYEGGSFSSKEWH